MICRQGKVVACQGDKSVLQLTNSERGEMVTILACCNATGNYIPPFVIFKGVRQKPEFSDHMPPGSVIKMSDTGYINTELFLQWLHHFKAHRTSEKVIVVIDGHASHVKSIEVLD